MSNTELDKDYINSNFNRLKLSDTYTNSMQLMGGAGGCTLWMSVTNEQVEAIRAILTGDRVLGHDTKTQIASLWAADDVHNARPDLSDEQAMKVLEMVAINHDAEIGINWGVIRYWADELYPEDIPQ